jgi:hypothetical protein
MDQKAMKGAMIQSKVIDQEQWKEQLIRKQTIDQGVRDGSRINRRSGAMKGAERWYNQKAIDQE